MQLANVHNYSSNSRQWKKFDVVCYCVCSNIENSELFAKGCTQYRH